MSHSVNWSELLMWGQSPIIFALMAWGLREAWGRRSTCRALQACREHLLLAEQQNQQLPFLTEKLQSLHQKWHDEQKNVVALEMALKKQEESFQEKLVLMNQAKQSLTETFQSLSLNALERNNRAFLDLAQNTLKNVQDAALKDFKLQEKSIIDVVSPIKQSLNEVDKKLQDLEKDRISTYEVLRHQVTDLITTQKELRSETANLVKALRAPHVRGRWGEMQLRRVVEMSGMTPHCDFIEQGHLVSDTTRSRPDMIVNLPGGKKVVIDAKAPLMGYLEALEATDDAHRVEHLRTHARHVRTHMLALSARQYWDQFPEGETPEFVVLFLPGETFFSAALEHDASLLELGAEKRVILATPTTLMALLYAVAYGWRQEKVADNAREISNLGRELYKRVTDMGGHFVKLGYDLTTAVKSYNRTVGSLEGRVLPSARRFKELGASGQGDIESLAGIDSVIRELQAPEFHEPSEGILPQAKNLKGTQG